MMLQLCVCVFVYIYIEFYNMKNGQISLGKEKDTD